MSTVSQASRSNYWVWFDTLLEEHFWIEEGVVADQFLAKLLREGIRAQMVQAATPADALEAVFPDRKTTPMGSSRMH